MVKLANSKGEGSFMSKHMAILHEGKGRKFQAKVLETILTALPDGLGKVYLKLAATPRCGITVVSTLNI